MPPFKILDPDTRQVIQDALDSFLAPQADGGLGNECLLVYPPKKVPCDNCVFDAVNNRSSNRPASGAPVPFAAGSTCPLCNGRGLKDAEVTEVMTLKTEWDFKRFVNPPGDLKLRLPNSVVEVKGFMDQLPKLLKAEYLVLSHKRAGVLRQAFTLLGEPGDRSSMVPDRYFVSYWERKKK